MSTPRLRAASKTGVPRENRPRLPDGMKTINGSFSLTTATTTTAAAAFAFRHEGLLVCLALGSAIPLVLYLVPTVAPSMAPDESVLWGIRSGLTFGLPAGAVGFVVGLGARRLAGARRTGS